MEKIVVLQIAVYAQYHVMILSVFISPAGL